MKNTIARPARRPEAVRLGLVFAAPVLLASFLHFRQLPERPMHCDEGVNAEKFRILLEDGRFEYDPKGYHGPTLFYLTLPSAWLQGASGLEETDETTLRRIPALFGVLLVAAHVLLAPVLGPGAAAFAALLAALSPAMVFYSRYYIHEILLVCFSLGALACVCRWRLNPVAGWAVGAGAFLGLMHATKETSVIACAALALAFGVNRRLERRGNSPGAGSRGLRPARHLLVGILTAAAVSGLLYSSFLTNPRGIVDSFIALWNYFELATTPSFHIHPWHFYLELLAWFPAPDAPLWTSGLICVLALIGLYAGFRRADIPGVDAGTLRILGLYTLFMGLIYSAIPYKTPWCLLGFLHGMILLAAAGAVFLYRSGRGPLAQTAVAAVLAVGTAHLGWQAWAASFRFSSDPRNPWVYAHTGEGVYTIARKVEELAAAHPEGFAVPVQIISRENLWPMPWYLRRFSGVRWWNGVSDEAPVAPLILATPDMEEELARRLYEVPPPGERELYMNVFDRYVELRPQVELRGYAAKTLWDEHLRLSAQTPPAPPADLRK